MSPITRQLGLPLAILSLEGIRNATSVRHFFLYLALVGCFFLLFLIAASSLPDEASEGVDLREFYERNRRYFWSLVALFEITYVAFGIHFLGSVMDRLPHAVVAMIVGFGAITVRRWWMKNRTA